MKPKTGPTGGMGRSYAQPKHSDSGGAHNNNFKRQRTLKHKQHARNGHEHQPGRGFQTQKPNGFDPNQYCELHNKQGHDLAGCNEMKKQAAKMRAAWMTAGKGGGQNDRLHYQKTEDKNFHTMVEQMVSDSLQQQQKKRKTGSVHFASEVAMMPIKQEHISDDEDNIAYGPKDHELNAFNEMQLKATQDDSSDDENEVYT
jgi:hypothetical protein